MVCDLKNTALTECPVQPHILPVGLRVTIRTSPMYNDWYMVHSADHTVDPYRAIQYEFKH